MWQSKAHMDRWAAEQPFPAFQSLGLTDVASNMEVTPPEAGAPCTRSRPTARLNRPGVSGGGVRATATGAAAIVTADGNRPGWAEASTEAYSASHA